ncbi:MAG: hypothetical protein LBC27_09990 [Spirochaetaceae bacterium]|jgi:hypothetical protein|nr:hypothetical protein [Spirochaetaceae bacterium]
MGFQEIAVMVIGAAALIALVLYVAKIFKRKGDCCCGSEKCPHCKKE